MENKKLIQTLGFKPKENTTGIFYKKYSEFDNYAIEIDFEKKKLNFGNKIKTENKTTQNFSQPENWVVLECVDRLLQKGYKPDDITLEKTFKVGHGASGGRLDVLVEKEGSAYLMIECKTWGAEFDKEFKNLEKNGGQLFTYFQQDKNADILMLYSSGLNGEGVNYRNEIVKIEEHYRQAGNVEDVFDRWNKISIPDGIFDPWVNPYLFENKKLTKEDLKPLTEEDSQKIFYQFLSILRKHSVSDKPNAFNKIFNLFLAKIYDERKRDDDELDFQWKENTDDPVDFQIRLINLYKQGMEEFLEKEIEGISDDDFNWRTTEELKQKKKKWLKFNKVFDIKEVVDEESFQDNQRVLKEVVELLHKYKIRYPRKQQHLSDFFERLLTTGLKQEAGQFFTPPPITRFITRCLPIRQKILESLNTEVPKLPAVIDYAVGSGHFITEMMEEYQNTLDSEIDTSDFYPEAIKQLNAWKINKYDWAATYMYGIEKDYRLVKVAKVGCYFYGDGLAQVIHGDGLDNFEHSKSYRGLLKKNAEKPQFSFIVSNPPYSVSSFKGDLKNTYAKDDFTLYNNLTDRSSEIECLFVERTKQLLKTDGIAAIILPETILNNTGIQTKAREIILKYFKIVAIVMNGKGAFMETDTGTVTLFLKRRKDEVAAKIENAVQKFFTNLQDVTINGIEQPINKYLAQVWEGITFEDYKTLLQKAPNETIKQNEIYQEYQKKIKAKNDSEKWDKILTFEQEKLLYFILVYKQKLVLVKTGQKSEAKQFLGYKFSGRKESEGIHPIQRGKNIDDCTQLYDVNSFTNPEKASTYIYKALSDNKFNLEISENLQNNISYKKLIEIISFEETIFSKKINLTTYKEVNFNEIWETEELIILRDIAYVKKGKTITEAKTIKGDIPVIAGGKQPAYYHNEANRKGNVITVSASGANSGFINYFNNPIFASDCNTIISRDESVMPTKLIFHILKSIQKEIYKLQLGQAQPHVYGNDLEKIEIPVLSNDKQRLLLDEINNIEEKSKTIVVKDLEDEIKKIILKHIAK